MQYVFTGYNITPIKSTSNQRKKEMTTLNEYLNEQEKGEQILERIVSDHDIDSMFDTDKWADYVLGEFIECYDFGDDIDAVIDEYQTDRPNNAQEFMFFFASHGCAPAKVATDLNDIYINYVDLISEQKSEQYANGDL